MTIDESIAHAKEVAENRDDICPECRAEHQQLAEWLEELKSYRKDYACAENRAYNNAIDDAKQLIHNIYSQNLYCLEDKCESSGAKDDIQCDDCFFYSINKQLNHLKEMKING